jgi:hypothetical protein
MNADFMRLIDRRLGVPICLALSFVHGLRKIFSKPRFIKKPNTFLFIGLSEMGWLILFLKKLKSFTPRQNFIS